MQLGQIQKHGKHSTIPQKMQKMCSSLATISAISRRAKLHECERIYLHKVNQIVSVLFKFILNTNLFSQTERRQGILQFSISPNSPNNIECLQQHQPVEINKKKLFIINTTINSRTENCLDSFNLTCTIPKWFIKSVKILENKQILVHEIGFSIHGNNSPRSQTLAFFDFLHNFRCTRVKGQETVIRFNYNSCL